MAYSLLQPIPRCAVLCCGWMELNGQQSQSITTFPFPFPTHLVMEKDETMNKTSPTAAVVVVVCGCSDERAGRAEIFL